MIMKTVDSVDISSKISYTFIGNTTDLNTPLRRIIVSPFRVTDYSSGSVRKITGED